MDWLTDHPAGDGRLGGASKGRESLIRPEAGFKDREGRIMPL